MQAGVGKGARDAPAARGRQIAGEGEAAVAWEQSSHLPRKCAPRFAASPTAKRSPPNPSASQGEVAETGRRCKAASARVTVKKSDAGCSSLRVLR
jgi:hypothetical protein